MKVTDILMPPRKALLPPIPFLGFVEPLIHFDKTFASYPWRLLFLHCSQSGCGDDDVDDGQAHKITALTPSKDQGLTITDFPAVI